MFLFHIKKYSLTFVLFFIGICLGELGARCFYPESIVRLCAHPDSDLGNFPSPDVNYFDTTNPSVYKYHVRTNKLGLRMNDQVVESPETKKIIMMGNSSVFGWGAEIEDTFYGLLSRGVSRRFKKTQLLNAGVLGYSTGHVVKALPRFLAMTEIDAVIYVMSSVDFDNNLSRDPAYRVFSYSILDNKVIFKSEKVYSPFKRFLFKIKPYIWLNNHSYFFNLVKKRVFPGKNEAVSGEAALQNAARIENQSLALAVNEEYINQLVALCNGKSLPLAIVWLPSRQEVFGDDGRSQALGQFKASLSNRKDLRFFDPTDEMKLLITKNASFSNDINFPDGHLTVAGNSLFANAIDDHIFSFLETLT